MKKIIDGDANMSALLHRHLMWATEQGAKYIGCSGASYVISGIGIWGAELTEVDAHLTAQLFSVLSTIYNPDSTKEQKGEAEQQRKEVIREIYAKIDLAMSEPSGSE